MKARYLNLILCLWLTACAGRFEVGIAPSHAPTPTQPTGTALWAGLTQSPTHPTDPGQPTDTATPTTPPTGTDVQVNVTPLPADTATPARCVPPLQWVAYTIKPGDTLFELSLRTNISVQALQTANCLTGTTIRAGQQLYLPYLPAPSATSTFTPTSPLPTPDPQAVWATGGKRYATPRGVVVDIELQRVALVIAESSPWLRFWGWTAEGRFAIFTQVNQYANGRMTVFDTLTWSTIVETSGCGSPSVRCGEYPFALYPFAPRLLQVDGRLMALPEGSVIDLLAGWRSGSMFVSIAGWSPDGASLVFVANTDNAADFALYLARGDGTQVDRITSIDSYPQLLQWTADNKVATTTTSLNRYILDVASKQVLVVPAATATPTATPSGTATGTTP